MSQCRSYHDAPEPGKLPLFVFADFMFLFSYGNYYVVIRIRSHQWDSPLPCGYIGAETPISRQSNLNIYFKDAT